MLNANINRLPITRWRRFATAIVLIAAALPVAAASAGAGAPGGVLRDPSGRVLPGATVRLSAIGQEAIHETQSDSSGSFQFGELADGEYMLSARLPGFQSSRQRVVVSPSMAPLNVTLQVGTLRETITIRSNDSAQTATVTKSARPMPGARRPPARRRSPSPGGGERYEAAGAPSRCDVRGRRTMSSPRPRRRTPAPGTASTSPDSTWA